jgi:guanylate kinase
VVISGPSGVGKSTICHRLCDMLPAEFSVSVTTRRPRPGEQNARDYEYVSPEDFLRLRDGDALLEWAEVYGHQYGTPRGPIDRAIAEGRITILEIDIKGCVQVRQKLPEAVTIFLLPPSPEEQKRRIEGRNTDSAEVIRRRLDKADGEIRYAAEAGCYDEFIVNDDLDETVKMAYQIVCRRKAEQSRLP